MIGCIPDLYYSEITSSTLICKLLPDLVGFRLLCCAILLQIFYWIAICLSSRKVSLKWRLNSLHYAEVWGREDLFGVFFRHHFQHNSKLWGTKCTVHLSLFMCSNILPLLLSCCTASGKINYHLIHTVNVHLPTNLTQFHLSAEALPGKFSCLSNHDWMFSSIDFKSRFFLGNCNVLEQSCTTFAEW